MKKFILFLIFPLFLFLIHSCSTSTSPPPPPAKVVVDASKAIEKANAGYALLENVMFDLMTHEGIPSPGEIDFRLPAAAYDSALYYDYTNLDANFGLAFCNLMTITQDTAITNTIDSLSSYFSNNRPFEAPLSKSRANNRSAIFPTSIRIFNLPELSIAKTIVNTHKMALTNPPMLSEIQLLLENILLEARLKPAIDQLNYIENKDQTYVFPVSHKMQGDLSTDVDTLELDMTEIYAFNTSLHILRGIVDIILSYNVDFTSYDSLGLIETLSQDSDFMTARDGGSFMRDAGESFGTAIDKMEAGIEFLIAEAEDPDYDQDIELITIGSGGIAAAEIDSVQKYIDSAKDFLSSDNSIGGDWDRDPQTPEEDITINLRSFFSSPILDFKALLPGYTITVDIDTTDWDYTYFSGDSAISEWVYEPSSVYRTFNKSFYWYNNDNVDSSITTTLSLPDFDSALYNKIEELRQIPDTYYARVYISWSGWVVGEYQINTYLRWSYQFRDPEYATYYPILTWDADTFEDWDFPDATFNGMLPGMTDSEFKRIFGINGEGWQKTIDIFGNDR